MADSEKKDKSGFEKFGFGVLKFLLALACVFVASFLVTSFLTYKAIKFDVGVVLDGKFLIVFGLGFLLYILFKMMKLAKAKPEDSGAKIKTKGGIKKYFDSNWLTPDQMKKIYQFRNYTYDELKNVTKIGIPVRAELVNGKLEVNMYENIHTMVIGTTGSGKSSQIINPTIQILSETAAKPCFVVTDPKGELYYTHSNKLRKRGYNVLVFDLQDPFKSTCWNPMTRAFELNEKANNLNKMVKVHQNEDPRQTNLNLVATAYYNEWYELDGYAFADRPSLNSYIDSKKQALKNEAFEDLRDIASTLCPIQSNQDPIWERGAKDLVLGTMMAMMEDSEDPRLGMTKDKFNFYNLSKILNLKDNDPHNQIKSITDYFQGRGALSLAAQLANQVVTNADKTAKSYMGIVTDRMSIFSDTGVCYATSKNEMDLSTFASKPSALFIKIPDEKTTRHPIATMFISQLYKVLVDIARSNNGTLPRDCYFLLDEFANMPKIEGFDSMITVARSRKIWFILILQSYAQLTQKYGEQSASTIKDNCNIHIFLASNDQNTLEEFSKRCGNISVETESTTINKGKKDEQSSKTTAINIDTRPLIYPAELGSLKSEFVVSILKQMPIKSKFLASYLDEAKKIYDMSPPPPEVSLPKYLDEQSLYYDIKERNRIVLNQSDNYGSGFSDDW